MVHLHGALALGWVLLFVLQPSLIRAGRYDIHVRTGLLGLAMATAITAVPVALLAVERDPQFWLGVVAADSLMFAAMIRDRLVEGRVHPVWLWVGLPIFVEQTLEAVFYDAPLWRSAATFLYESLSGQAVPVA